MNPRKVMIHLKAYRQKVQREFEISNVIAHLQGTYYCEALLSTVGNMFAGKSSKPYEYPKKPYDIGNSNGATSEDEINKQRNLFVANYFSMMADFNINKEKEKGQEQ